MTWRIELRELFSIHQINRSKQTFEEVRKKSKTESRTYFRGPKVGAPSDTRSLPRDLWPGKKSADAGLIKTSRKVTGF
jgi:hypothetical protein